MSNSELLYNNRFYDDNINHKTHQYSDLLKYNNIDMYNSANINKSVDEKITTINIDSRDRNINPKNILDKTVYRLKNSLTFTKDSKIMKINHVNHGFLLDNKIIIQNVMSDYIILKNAIELKKNSSYCKIKHINHGLTEYDFTYNLIKIFITGFKGNKKKLFLY